VMVAPLGSRPARGAISKETLSFYTSGKILSLLMRIVRRYCGPVPNPSMLASIKTSTLVKFASTTPGAKVVRHAVTFG
jgi:hypothetical protein